MKAMAYIDMKMFRRIKEVYIYGEKSYMGEERAYMKEKSNT